MSQIADELSYRASPEYIGGRAKEKGRELGMRAKTSPMALGIVGGICGALVGAALGKRSRDRSAWGEGYDSSYYGRGRFEPHSVYGRGGYGEGAYGQAGYYGESTDVPVASYGVGYEGAAGYGFNENVGEEAGFRERMGEKAHELKERVGEKAEHMKESLDGKTSHLKERAEHAVDNLRERATHLRERVPSSSEVKARANNWYHEKAESQPMVLAVGAAALGAAVSLLLPLTNKERKVMSPIKERAMEQASALGSEVKERLQDVGGRVKEDLKSEAKDMSSSLSGSSSTGQFTEEPSLLTEETVSPIRSESDSGLNSPGIVH